MSSLGIYFGPKIISLVETQGKKLLKSIQIPVPAAGADLEGKVSPEAKLIQLVALFKDEFRKNKIEPSEAMLCLSGKELIIRAFEMPMLPRSELRSAINFEVKKYIPFKVEDMVSDYQVEFNRDSHVNLVLFVGIKKENLDKYVALLRQLNLKISTVEYAAFSVLRCLKLSGLGDRGIIAVANADLQGGDEANFTVLKNGFPLFSRDFLLTAAQEELAQAKEPAAPGMALEKFKTEIRVSLDYYMRKFSEARIQQMYFVCNPENRAEIGAFIKEMGLAVKFVDTGKYFGKDVPFSLYPVKSYGASLAKAIRGNLKIDILARRPQVERPGGAAAEVDIQQQLAALISGLNVDLRVLALGIVICAATFTLGAFRVASFQKALDEVIQARPQLSALPADPTEEDLQGVDTEYKKKNRLLNEVINKQFYLTKTLDIIPRLMSKGLWLDDLYFVKNEGRVELVLKGKAYTGDNDKDLSLVNEMVTKLKKDSGFSKIFKEINIESATQGRQADVAVLNFTVSCRGSG